MSCGVAPVAASSASASRWRRAPTANAGPASSTTCSSAIATTRPTTAAPSPLLLLKPCATDAGTAPRGGGWSATARESAPRPRSLSRRTLSHPTPPGLSTSQRRAAPSSARSPARPRTASSASSAGPRTVPTTRSGLPPERSATRVPGGKPRRAMCSVTAISPAWTGGRPVTVRNTLRGSGSERSTPTAAANTAPRAVRSSTSPSLKPASRECGGSRSSTSAGSGAGSGDPPVRGCVISSHGSWSIGACAPSSRTSAAALPSCSSSRSRGDRSAVRASVSIATIASTGKPTITSTSAVRPRARSASRRAIRRATRQAPSRALMTPGRGATRRPALPPRRRRGRHAGTGSGQPTRRIAPRA
jgi:hypothetical protein